MGEKTARGYLHFTSSPALRTFRPRLAEQRGSFESPYKKDLIVILKTKDLTQVDLENKALTDFDLQNKELSLAKHKNPCRFPCP